MCRVPKWSFPFRFSDYNSEECTLMLKEKYAALCSSQDNIALLQERGLDASSCRTVEQFN